MIDPLPMASFEDNMREIPSKRETRGPTILHTAVGRAQVEGRQSLNHLIGYPSAVTPEEALEGIGTRELQPYSVLH